jgi:hypothetical protein
MGRTDTFVAGLRLRGLAAPRVYDRPMNRFEDVGAGIERPHQAGDGSLGNLAQIGLSASKRPSRVPIDGPCNYLQIKDFSSSEPFSSGIILSF